MKIRVNKNEMRRGKMKKDVRAFVRFHTKRINALSGIFSHEILGKDLIAFS
jgi:hypothetical protein